MAADLENTLLLELKDGTVTIRLRPDLAVDEGRFGRGAVQADYHGAESGQPRCVRRQDAVLWRGGIVPAGARRHPLPGAADRGA